MSPLLEELEAVRLKYGLSYEEVGREIGCSPRTIYNWLSYRTTEPRPVWFRPIRAGIRRIERKYGPPPTVELEIHGLYDALRDKLTRAERDGILEILMESGGGNRSAYLEKLRELARRHHIEIETSKAEETKS